MMSRSQQGGFTLMEALVAAFISAIGLLGAASLQGSIMNNTKGASDRSVAATQTSNLVTHMKANRNYWRNLPGDFDIDVNALGAISDNGTSTEGAALEVLTVNCSVVVCAMQREAVAYQLKNWATSSSASGVGDRLPAGAVNVRRVNIGLPVIFEISVSWDQKVAASGMTMSAGFHSGGSRSQATYVVRVQP